MIASLEKIIDGHLFITELIYDHDLDDIHGMHLFCETCDPNVENAHCFPMGDYDDTLAMVQDVDAAARLHAATESPGLA